ncbi:DUF4157 domain-containing protein [Natronolimnobius sp. AArcel1]|uniref:eCIS core domain-containing protein n=1 Tax=Natronolimnobius sp. AArcel1 TaxID=1679093 RepID=UPI0013EA5170|nr:DUF4157 domain-containing protein [Natronolimnobius sp. AArcel1]NGM68019.1 DUF4157 domain-containing protein [Natronolimnobius sp. AArcel1]
MGSKKSRKRKTQSSDQTNERTSSQQSTRSSAAMGAQSVHGTALADESNLHGPNPDEVYGGDPLSSGVFGHPGIAPSPSELNIQRALEGTGTSQDEVPDTVLDVLGDGGKSLDQPIQRALEERMDADFSNVRIHTGAKAAEAADAIDAKAFTCGNDIVFNSGEYDPESGEGQFLLAHELAHVKQQTGAAISMMPQEGADVEIDPDPQLEREADETAKQALSGDEPVVVNRMGTDVHIQRMPEAESLEQAHMEAEERFGDRVSADPEVLAKEVEQIKANQGELFDAIKGDTAWRGRLGKAAGKGAIGAAGGLVGAAVGTMIAPGVGTAGGAVAGQQVLTELASGIASDVSKAAYDPAFEAGSKAIAEKSADFGTYIENLIDEKFRKRFGGTEHGGDGIIDEFEGW